MHLVFTVARETGRMQKKERDQGIPVAVIEQTGKWNLRLRERTWDRSQLISTRRTTYSIACTKR